MTLQRDAWQNARCRVSCKMRDVCGSIYNRQVFINHQNENGALREHAPTNLHYCIILNCDAISGCTVAVGAMHNSIYRAIVASYGRKTYGKRALNYVRWGRLKIEVCCRRDTLSLASSTLGRIEIAEKKRRGKEEKREEKRKKIFALNISGITFRSKNQSKTTAGKKRDEWIDLTLCKIPILNTTKLHFQ